MAISVNGLTGVIFVPQADLTMVSATEFTLDTNAFHITLRGLEASVNLAPRPTTHIHNTEVTIGGIVFVRQVIISDYYSVTFEDGSYAVTLLGSNNNILDVANLNSVSIRPTNSAGLIVTDTSGLTDTEAARLERLEQFLRNRTTTNPNTGIMTVFADDGVTPLFQAPVWEDAGQTVAYEGGPINARERLE